MNRSWNDLAAAHAMQTAAASRPSVQTTEVGMAARQDPVQEFNARVERLRQQYDGLTHKQAERTIAKQSPQLYQAYKAAAGTFSPLVAEFAAAVKAKTDAGMTRGEAVRAVVRAKPALHKAFLRAVNPGKTIV